jgi:hypothetical protein
MGTNKALKLKKWEKSVILSKKALPQIKFGEGRLYGFRLPAFAGMAIKDMSFLVL